MQEILIFVQTRVIVNMGDFALAARSIILIKMQAIPLDSGNCY